MLQKVYDIIDCGPRHRFVANGKLVHNCDGINLQNLPRKSRLRAAMMAPPGYSFVVGDLSQIELRIGLWLAGQLDLLQAFANGLDLYKKAAMSVFNVGYDEVDKEQRQVGKLHELSEIYGTSAKTVQKTTWVMTGKHLSMAQCESSVANYRSSHPKVVQAWREGQNVLNMLHAGVSGPVWNGVCRVENGAIVKPSGLALHYPNLRQEVDEGTGRTVWVYTKSRRKQVLKKYIYSSAIYQNVVQSLARDVLAVAVHRLNKARREQLPWLNLVGTVHDELLLLVPDQYAVAAKQLLEKALTKQEQWYKDVPLSCEVHIAKRYSEAK